MRVKCFAQEHEHNDQPDYSQTVLAQSEELVQDIKPLGQC